MSENPEQEKRDREDSQTDTWAVLCLILIAVAAAIYWVSSQ